MAKQEITQTSEQDFKGGQKEGAEADGRLLVFRLAGQGCAVYLNRVREIVPMARLSRPPGLPSIVEGFLNLGGAAVCVLRLDRLFNLSEREPGLYSTLLIMRTGGCPIAWLVDSVSEIVAYVPEARMPVSADQLFNGCTSAEVSVNGDTIHLLSPERVLLEQERQTVAQFQALEQQRLGNLQGVAA